MGMGVVTDGGRRHPSLRRRDWVHVRAGRRASRAFVLTITSPLRLLQAQEASRKAILDAIGCERAIDMVAHISEQEKMTVQSNKLPLTEALQR
jgi:hypothetical protein